LAMRYGILKCEIFSKWNLGMMRPFSTGNEIDFEM